MRAVHEISPARMLDACPLPDIDALERHRHDLSRAATAQGALNWPALSNQLLEVLEKVSEVDAATLMLIDGIDACLSNIDIGPYQSGIQKLDKPGRSAAENLALLGFQEEIAGMLEEGLAQGREYLRTLDASLSALSASFIEDARAPILQLQTRLGSMSGVHAQSVRTRLAQLQEALQVRQSRAGYVHEISKLMFAVNYFFDNVLEGGADVIQRAEDFLRHSDELVDYLRELRGRWKH